MDMQRTAELIAGAALVITVDTMTAHLAGALGRPTWVMVKHTPRLALADRKPAHAVVSPHASLSPAPPRRLGRSGGPHRGRPCPRGPRATVLPSRPPRRQHDGPAPQSTLTAAPLAPVSWGELLDKITILEIKNARIDCPKALANVRRELALLRGVAAPVLDRPGIAALTDDLRRINTALWQIEDDIRQKEARQQFDAGFVALARAVYRTNDARADVKRRINLTLGVRTGRGKAVSRGRGAPRGPGGQRARRRNAPAGPA